MESKQFIETWEIHQRINIYLLDSIDDAHMGDISASRGRTVGEQFAHLHNVRLMWLKSAAPELMEGQVKFEKDMKLTKKIIGERLTSSGVAITNLLQQGFESGKIKGFKPHAAAFLGYLVAHESHHRGQIILTLKQSGHMIPQKVQFGIWEWGSR